jgi:hypothetical protein
MRSFETHGLWSLPGAASPVAGTLRVSRGGDLRLSLLGSLGPPGGVHKKKEHPVILGSVDGPMGDEVTLAGCSVTRTRFGPPGTVREEYRAQRGFFGASLGEPSDLAFRRVQLRVGGLGAWARPLSGLREGGLGGRPGGEEAPLLYYTTPSPVGGRIADGEISLGFGLTSSSTRRRYTYAEHPGVVLTCDHPLSEGEIHRRLVYPLQNLMTFACDRAQEVKEVSLWREDILAPAGENPEIRLVGARVFPEAEDDEAEGVDPHELLFGLADVECEFAPFVERWLRLTSKYSDACDVFFGLMYGPPAYLDVTFLGVVESLALYYTRREDGAAHREEEARRLGDVLNKLPPADADWVRSHIRPRPFPPFQAVLGKLVDEQAEAMTPLFQTDKWGFIREVIGTFVYTIHRDPPFDQVVNSGAELYWMTAKLRTLLRVCFLRELGFSADAVLSLLKKNGGYQQLCRLVAAQRTGQAG